MSKGTLILQSFTPPPWPAWRRRCIRSVERWAAGKGCTHRFIGDELFDPIPPAAREGCKGARLPLADIGRLMWLERLLAVGWRRVIWLDADILIFCISQLMAALNKGAPVSRHLTLTAHDLLLATHRETSGDAYRRLREAFERLAGTRITTNIATGAGDDLTETTTGFGLIESWEIVRKTRKGRMVSVSVTLSERV